MADVIKQIKAMREVEAHLKGLGYRYSVDKSGELITLHFNPDGDIKDINCMILVKDTIILMYAYSYDPFVSFDINDTGLLRRAAEYINRINYTIRIGSLKINFQEGVLTHEIFTDIRSYVPSQSVINNHIRISCERLVKWMPGFIAVIDKGVEPRLAFECCRDGKPIPAAVQEDIFAHNFDEIFGDTFGDSFFGDSFGDAFGEDFGDTFARFFGRGSSNTSTGRRKSTSCTVRTVTYSSGSGAGTAPDGGSSQRATEGPRVGGVSGTGSASHGSSSGTDDTGSKANGSQSGTTGTADSAAHTGSTSSVPSAGSRSGSQSTSAGSVSGGGSSSKEVSIDLGVVVREYPQTMANKLRLRGILMDLYPYETRQINLAMYVYENNLLDEIRETSHVDPLRLGRWVRMLEDDYGISEENARMALDLWIKALHGTREDSAEGSLSQDTGVELPAEDLSGTSDYGTGRPSGDDNGTGTAIVPVGPVITGGGVKPQAPASGTGGGDQHQARNEDSGYFPIDDNTDIFEFDDEDEDW